MLDGLVKVFDVVGDGFVFVLFGVGFVVGFVVVVLVMVFVGLFGG